MRITVLMGGTSAERDVSMASGVRIVRALRERGHEVSAVDPATGVLDEASGVTGDVGTAPPSLEALSRISSQDMSPALGTLPEVRDADVVFLGLHGGQGEDGTIQALLDLVGARYTGSGHLASALAMDKDLSKLLFRAAGVQTADWLMATAGSAPSAADVGAALGWPVIVKPSKQGSTVGLTLVKSSDELAAAIAEALLFDDEVMIERFVPGRELTVGILGDEALPVGEIISAHEIYDYECKYTAGMAREDFPAKLAEAETRAVQDQAIRAFRALKLRGYARIDFRMAPDGQFYCLEANTLPGMTDLSLIPQAAAARGISFGELCERIALLALGDGGDGARSGGTPRASGATSRDETVSGESAASGASSRNEIVSGESAASGASSRNEIVSGESAASGASSRNETVSSESAAKAAQI